MKAQQRAPGRRSRLRTLFGLELRLLLADRAVLAAVALFGLVLALAAWLSGHHATTHSDALAHGLAAQHAERAAAVETLRGLEAAPHTPLTAKDPRDPAAAGQELAATLAHLPAGPLASVSAGLREVRSHALIVSTAAPAAYSTASATPLVGPGRQASGAFDPAFVFVILFPLLAIALSYDVLSGERERGTLALLLSQPLTQRQLVLGKALARAALLLAVGVLFGWLGVLLSGGELIAGGAWARALAYALGISAYGLFWFALAVAVNSRGGASARNALVLIGLWLAFTVVVPGLLRVWVETRYPPPSRVELVNEAREAAEEAEAELGALEGQHGASSTAPASGEVAMTAVQRAAAVQAELSRRTAPVIAAFQEQLEAQQRLVSALQYASPAVLLQELLNDLAGTGSQRHQHFERQVDDFRARWRDHFLPKIAAGERMTVRDYDALPRFEFEEEPAGALLSRVALALLGLLVPAGLLAAAALPGLRRVGRLSA